MYNHTIIESIQSQYFKCKEEDETRKYNLLCSLLDDNYKILIKKLIVQQKMKYAFKQIICLTLVIK